MKFFFSKKKDHAKNKLQPIIRNTGQVPKAVFFVSPTAPEAELCNLGTFPEHLWKLIFSKMSIVGCLFTIAYVCKAFYFVAKTRVTLTQESLFGNWAFILSSNVYTGCLSSREFFYVSGNISEPRDGLVRGFGMAPFRHHPEGCPVYAIGICKGKTIAATSYFMPKGDPSKSLFSFIFVHLKFSGNVGDSILMGITATKDNMHNNFVLPKPIVGIKVSEKHVPLNKIQFTNERTPVGKIALQKLPGRIQQKLRAGIAKVPFPERVVVNLVGKWTLTFEFDQEKLELDAETEPFERMHVVSGEVKSGLRNGEKGDFSGLFGMSVNALGTFGLSISLKTTQATNIILTAIVEVFVSQKEIFGECVMENGEAIKTGSFVGGRI